MKHRSSSTARSIVRAIVSARRMPRQSHAGRLAEQRAIFIREAAQMPKAEVHGSRGYRGFGIWSLQLLAGEIHAPQPQILHRAHAEMFLAAPPQSRRRDVKRGTDFVEIDRAIMVGIEPLPEAQHDLLVTMPSGAMGSFGLSREAGDHRNSESLLQRSLDFGMIEHLFTRKGHSIHFLKEVSQPAKACR